MAAKDYRVNLQEKAHLQHCQPAFHRKFEQFFPGAEF